MADWPLAYFITFTCYGTWLHGREVGSVDRRHNEPGSALLPADPARQEAVREAMRHPPYHMDAPRRRIVLGAIRGVCAHRGWSLVAAHVRSNHLHASSPRSALPSA